MLAKYAESPAQHWRSKDAAMYMVTSLVSRGSTEKHGVTKTSQLVSVPQFCQQQVLPELDKPDGKTEDTHHLIFCIFCTQWISFLILSK